MKSFLLLTILLIGSNVVASEDVDKQSLTTFLLKLNSSYNKVEDYSATMKLENFQGKYQLQKQKMWFKKPGYLLLKQLGPFKKGAVLAIRPDGVIKGHLGGFLSFAVATVDKDDDNMFGVTHDSALTTDYGKIIEIALDLADRVNQFSITSAIEKSKKQLVLDTYYNDKVDHIRLIIDAEKMLIIRLERYSKNKMIHKIQWFDLKLNTNMQTKIFDL